MAARSVLHGARVVAADGELGRVRHIVVDERLEEATDLVVGRDGEEWLVPMSAVTRVEGDRVTVTGARSLYRGARPFNPEEYDVVEEPAGDDRAAAGFDGGPDSPTATSLPAPDGPDFPPPGYRLQLREERLRVRTEPEEAGVVRVTKRVVERTETVSVPLREERLVIEVVPGTGSVRVGDRELREGETLEVSLREERLVVDTEVVVHEDVTVRKEVVEHAEPVSATLRKKELVVDTEGEAAVEQRDAAGEPAEGEPTERHRALQTHDGSR